MSVQCPEPYLILQPVRRVCGKPTTRESLNKVWNDLARLAFLAGHRLGAPEQDSDLSLVGFCDRCGRMAAVDIEDPEAPFTMIEKGLCNGDRPA